MSMMTVSRPRETGGIDGIEGNRSWIAAGGARHAGKTQPVGPDLKLGDGAGAIGIGRGQQQTVRPSDCSREASLAAVVVFPLPFTPTSRTRSGLTRLGPGNGTGILWSGMHGAESLPQGPLEVRLRLELPAADLVLQGAGELDWAATPKSASINTRSMFSRSSALRPRMSAPTSVSAIA